MKTDTVARIYAFAMSTVFATVATLGIAVMMTSSAEHLRTGFSSAAAQTVTQPASANLSL